MTSIKSLYRRLRFTSPHGRGESSLLRWHLRCVHIALAAALLLRAADAQTPAHYKIVGDGIAEQLTGAPGDATRGRALVLDRTTTCILCHSGPFGTQFQGDLAPSLAGAGNRWT